MNDVSREIVIEMVACTLMAIFKDMESKFSENRLIAPVYKGKDFKNGYYHYKASALPSLGNKKSAWYKSNGI